MDAKCRAAFPEIERRIKAGGRILEVLQPRERFPDYNVLSKFLESNPDFDARYRAAFREREAGPNAIGQAATYSDRELRRAAADLLQDNRRDISTLRVTPGGPHVQTLLRARFRDPELRCSVETAVTARRARLHIVHGRPLVTAPPLVPAPAIIVRIAPRQGEQLASSLSQNEIWRLAAAALPKTLDRDMRDDIIAEIAIEVLEGNLSAHLIASEAKRFVREYNRKFSPYQFASLDKSVAFDSTLSFVDSLTTDAWE
jgi:hypothetical protein